MVEAVPESGNKKLRIAILGATGAIGKEIIHFARNNEKVGELILIVRRTLEEWQQSDFTPKLTFIIKENYNSFEDVKE